MKYIRRSPTASKWKTLGRMLMIYAKEMLSANNKHLRRRRKKNDAKRME